MRQRIASVARSAIAVLVLVSASSCGGSTPSSPTSTTTTTTTTTTSIATTSTSTVLTSSVLTVALAPNCAGVVQASGVDVFLDGQLVGVATQNQPFVRTVSIGTHTIRARDRDGFLPETTVNIQTATFLFTITCG
jgi:hypothetical protein